MPSQFSVSGGSVSGNPSQASSPTEGGLMLGSLGCCCSTIDFCECLHRIAGLPVTVTVTYSDGTSEAVTGRSGVAQFHGVVHPEVVCFGTQLGCGTVGGREEIGMALIFATQVACQSNYLPGRNIKGGSFSCDPFSAEFTDFSDCQSIINIICLCTDPPFPEQPVCKTIVSVTFTL